MKAATCIIVDDEKYARNILEQYIKGLEGLELVAKCNNAVEAFNILLKEHIDLVFLDIKMPQLSGLELAKSIPPSTKVIFTTALKEHALESYQLNAIDYLLKPISHERFLNSLSKFFKIHSGRSILPESNKTSDLDRYIFLRVDRKNTRVFLNDILYVQGLKDYVIVKAKDKDFITYLKLNYLAAKLPEQQFIRIHKSYIVATSKVASYTSLDIELENGVELPIGKTYQSIVLESLKKAQL